MARSTKPDARKLRLRQHLYHALEEFFEEQMDGSGAIEIKVVDDLILLRCKKAISPSEVDLGAVNVGRLLLQEATERLCRELKPDLKTLLYEFTGLRLLDMGAVLFVERREKLYLFLMSDTVKWQA